MMILPSVRARSVLATSSHVELGILGERDVLPAHLVEANGAILMRPGEGPCWERLDSGEECPELDLVANDVTSVPQPDRLRARVRMRGRVSLVDAPPHRQVLCHLGLSLGQSMARFTPDTVILDVPSGRSRSVVAVPLPAYTQASSDPLAGWESAWIAHLDTARGASLRQLAMQRIPLTDDDTVRALQADSFGLTLRIYRAGDPRDLRIDFPDRAGCGCRALAVFQHLVAGLKQE